MYVPETEEEQIEQLKGWLRDYGPSFAIGVVLALVIGFGWNYWQQHKLRIARAASVEYSFIMNDVMQDNFSDARIKANHIIKEYSHTPYALWSAMALARLDIEHDEYDAAREQLQWVIDNSKDKAITQTARIRLAKIFIAEKKPDLAIAQLELKSAGPHFSALIQGTLGDAYIAQGNKTAAKKAFQTAVTSLEKQGINPPAFLKMKLQNVDSLQGE